MNTDFPVPTVDELPERIRTAYESLPAPDADRLAYIETQLKRHLKPGRRRTTMPWWAWLLLGTGAATAAWWAGEAMRSPAVDRPVEESIVLPARTDHESARAADEMDEQQAEQIDEQRSPVIYQRENY
jgi:hypothetical protein